MRRRGLAVMAFVLTLAAVPAARAAEYSGRVLTADGAPVADAEVWLFYAHDWTGYGSRRLAETRSGPDGAYRIAAPSFEPPAIALGFPVRRTYLVVRHPGCVLAVLLVHRNKPGGWDFRLEPGRSVVFTVLDADGAPVKDAQVRALSFTYDPSKVPGFFRMATSARLRASRAPPALLAQVYSARTDERGKATLRDLPRARAVVFSAKRSGKGRGFAFLKAGDGRNRVTLRLKVPSTDRRGKVTDADTGKPVSGMVASDSVSSHMSAYSVTDDSGAFALELYGFGIARPGRQGRLRTIVVRDPRRVPLRAAAFSERPEGEERDKAAVEALKMKRGVPVLGVVRDPKTRAPLAGATVSAILTLGVRRRLVLRRITGAKGRFFFRLSGERCRVGVSAAPPGCRFVERPKARDVEIKGPEVRLELAAEAAPDAGVEIRVERPDGKPAAGAYVVGGAQGMRSGAVTAVADARGRAWLMGAPGRKALILYIKSADQSLAAWKRVSADLVAAGKSVAVRLRPARSVRVVFEDQQGKALRNPRFANVSLWLAEKDGTMLAPAAMVDVSRGRGGDALLVRGLLPNADYVAHGYCRGERVRGYARNVMWRFGPEQAEPVMKLRITPAPAVRRPEGWPRGPRPPGRRPGRGEQTRSSFDQDLKSLAKSEWRKADPYEKNLLWLGYDLAVADAKAKQVRRFAGLFDYKAFRAIGIAFTPESVYVATDKGMFSWDRKGKYWNRFAVGGAYVDAPVVGFRVVGGAWRVTIQEKGRRPLRFEYDTKTRKWKDL